MIYVYNCKEEDHTQEPNNFYIGRSRKGNPLANPFGVAGKRPSFAKMTFPTRDEAIDAYKLYFESAYGKDPALTVAFDEIYEGFVPFSNGSWIYGDTAYDSGTKKYISISGNRQMITAKFQKEMAEYVQEFIRINNLILESDHYK